MSDTTQTLCLSCGLCCTGVLFKDVELQAGDDAGNLKTLGLPVSAARSVNRPAHFNQPCAALAPGCRCGIYKDRPTRCRQFECSLFQAVAGGEVEMSAALRTVKQAHQRAAQVRRLLLEIGDDKESLALSLRFKRTKKRAESTVLDETTADLFGQLTLAVHDLNVILRDKFYP